MLDIVVPIIGVHRHMDRDFRFTPSPYGTPLRGSTILPSSVAPGYRLVYRASYSGMIQAQFAATHYACKSNSDLILIIYGRFIIIRFLYCGVIL